MKVDWRDRLTQFNELLAVFSRSAPIDPLTAIVSPVMDRDAVVEYVYHEYWFFFVDKRPLNLREVSPYREWT